MSDQNPHCTEIDRLEQEIQLTGLGLEGKISEMRKKFSLRESLQERQ